MTRLVGVFFRLARPDASALVFLSVFLPLLARTGSLRYSLRSAFPLLLIGICIYMVNHLDDIESDRINHPGRPLPSGQISPTLVVPFYFICLLTALFLTRIFVVRNEFLYYLLLILGVNYRYITEHVPKLKSTYVASATTIPVLALIGHFPESRDLPVVAASVFLFTLGKELCMDFLDRAGDPNSFIHSMTLMSLGIVAFSAQAAGILLLAFLVETALDAAALLVLVALAFLAGLFWFSVRVGEKALLVMKLQLLIGLLFLL